ERAEDAQRSTRARREAYEPVRERLAAPAPLQLLHRARAPPFVDGLVRLDLLEIGRFALEVLGPEPHPRLAGALRVADDDVQLRVVEERVLVQVRRADRQPAVVDDADLRVHVDG